MLNHLLGSRRMRPEDVAGIAHPEFRALIAERVARRPTDAVSLQVCSFGYKNGVPRDADFVFDLRSLPNPYWKVKLRGLTGMDEEVRRFLDKQDDAHWAQQLSSHPQIKKEAGAVSAAPAFISLFVRRRNVFWRGDGRRESIPPPNCLRS